MEGNTDDTAKKLDEKLGADYSKGAYGWTLDLDTVKRSVKRQLHDLKTEYIDYGFIHCQEYERNRSVN